MPTHALRTTPNVQQAPSHDGLLHLAKNFNKHPDVLIGDGNSILGAGMPGAGKTTVMALLLEQFGVCGIPLAVFDLEGDLRSVVDLLPRGVLATPDNCPSAEEMYTYGLQVVFDLSAWGEDSNRAAALITRTVNRLLSHMKALPSHVRVPFLVGLDEAAYWLPQVHRGCNHLSPERLAELFAAFHALAVRGRKMGLIPMLFTQRFANLHKDVIAPGTYVLMRQTTDVDLKRYMEYIDASSFGEDEGDMTRIEMRQAIAAFGKGQAILKLPDGRQKLIQFNNRASLHTSHAPKTQAAANLYRDTPFDKNRRYGSDQTNEDTDTHHTAEPATSNLRVLETGARGATPTLRGQIFALLEKDPAVTSTDLVLATGYSVSGVGRYLAEYFARYPERRVEAPTFREQVYALLEKDPTLTPKDLAKRTGASGESTQKYLAEYFARYPERRVEAPTFREQVYALLEKDPTLTPKDLASVTVRPLTSVTRYRAEYFVRHPERNVTPPTAKEQIFAALEKDPALTNKDLSSMTRATLSNVRSYRADYFALYPDRRVEEAPALQSRVFAALEKDPTLTSRDLAEISNCPVDRAASYRHRYFARYPEKGVTP